MLHGLPRFRFGRRYPTLPWTVLLVAAAVLAVRFPQISLQSPAVAVESEVVRVLRAVDGDTLLLEDGRRIRLLGVDTPETKHPKRPPEPFGPEASAFTAQLVDGQEVRLVYDRERFDDYGRWLAYVYQGDELLNELLILEGLSKAVVSFPIRSDMKRRFENAQESARIERKGIWSIKGRP